MTYRGQRSPREARKSVAPGREAQLEMKQHLVGERGKTDQRLVFQRTRTRICGCLLKTAIEWEWGVSQLPLPVLKRVTSWVAGRFALCHGPPPS